MPFISCDEDPFCGSNNSRKLGYLPVDRERRVNDDAMIYTDEQLRIGLSNEM